MLNRSRLLAVGLGVASLTLPGVAPSAATARERLYRDATLTAHGTGYPAVGSPPQATLSSVVIQDDVFGDRTSFTVKLAGAPPSPEQSYRLTVGLGKYNVDRKCVLVNYASATKDTWLDQPQNDSYFGNSFSRSDNTISAQVFQGTVAPSKPVDEGFDCGGAVLDFHADDGHSYDSVPNTDRMLGRLSTRPSKPAVSAKKLNAKAGKVKVRVSCESAVDCRGVLAIKFEKRLVLGKSSYAVAPGKSKLIAVKLTKRGRRLLDKRTKVRATVTVTPATGRTVAKKLTVTR